MHSETVNHVLAETVNDVLTSNTSERYSGRGEFNIIRKAYL